MILQIWYFCSSTLTCATQWHHGLVHSISMKGAPGQGERRVVRSDLSCILVLVFWEGRKKEAPQRRACGPTITPQVGRPVSLDETGGGDNSMQDSHTHWKYILHLSLIENKGSKVWGFSHQPLQSEPGSSLPVGLLLLENISPLKTSYIDHVFVVLF